MAERLPAEVTPVDRLEVAVALAQVWRARWGMLPSTASLLLLVGQWALETGWGKACWNYNLGNAKSVPGDGRDFTFFACNEVLPVGSAERLVAAAPLGSDGQGRSAIIAEVETAARHKRIGRDDGLVIAWFYPDHPACRFRAFRSLEEGAADYLELLRQRYASAWAQVEAGELAGFVTALKRARYFTADEAQYLATLRGVVAMLVGLPWRETIEQQDRADAEAAFATGMLAQIENERPQHDS